MNDQYKILRNESTLEDIYLHLMSCDQMFTPPLSSRVNIRDYAKKLYEKSERIELIIQNKLVSILAFYTMEHKIYITNISTLRSWQGKGIAQKLIGELMSDSKYQHLEIYLDMTYSNKKVLDFYVHLGFKHHHLTPTGILTMKMEKRCKEIMI